MTCERPCWEHTHRAGRCKCGTNASRAAIGLAPLPEDDTPIETTESAEESAWSIAQGLLALSAAALLAFGLAGLMAGVK